MDPIRILTVHGPTGGRCRDVEESQTVTASHDIVVAAARDILLGALSGTPEETVAAESSARGLEEE